MLYALCVEYGKRILEFTYLTFIKFPKRSLIPLPGDADGNGAVDLADAYILNATFGQTRTETGPELQADFNNDYTVDLKDFVILRTNYGMVSGSGVIPDIGDAPLPTPVLAPEPATVFVLFGAAPLLLKLRNRRRKA